MFVTLVILSYIVAVITNYLILRKLYKKRWCLINPELEDLFFIFCPLINIIIMLPLFFTLIEYYIEHMSEYINNNTNFTNFMKKFFRI